VTVEILVIDDCPEGSARSVVESLNDSRIMYKKNDRPTGGVPSIVRNIGWPLSNGQFVHFLDDDDLVPSGHYAFVKSQFDKYPNIGMVFGRVEPFGQCPPSQLEHEVKYFENVARRAAACASIDCRFAFASAMLFGPAMLVCSAAVIRRACVERVGGFDPEIRLLEDADFFARVMRTCGARFLDSVSLQYRIGSPSLMHSPAPSALQLQRQRDGHRRMQRKYRAEHGALEFLLLALFSRTVLRYAFRRHGGA
jgi:hypothetical protein